jgi:hypothetical protein
LFIKQSTYLNASVVFEAMVLCPATDMLAKNKDAKIKKVFFISFPP